MRRSEPKGGWQHGLHSTYSQGCRCESCRQAASEWRRRRLSLPERLSPAYTRFGIITIMGDQFFVCEAVTHAARRYYRLRRRWGAPPSAARVIVWSWLRRMAAPSILDS